MFTAVCAACLPRLPSPRYVENCKSGKYNNGKPYSLR